MSTPKHSNELINETSPYLLQHAHNPVQWMPWGEKALQKAKAENKLLVISVGYSACHWCHVMERESFEDEEVAAIMNEHYVSIKVDREERPDVDQVYMDAAKLLTGRGGWPLNVIALADGKPIYAGTYFRKEDWKKVLLYFVDYMKNESAEAQKRVEQIMYGLSKMDDFALAAINKKTDEPAMAEKIYARFASRIEALYGNNSGAPKFPMPVIWRYALCHYYLTKEDAALKSVNRVLQQMMNGGIYDHVGGGFARYSVDERWEIPHFEKMLYDNAQLISLYADAFRITKNERYREVVYETVDFLERELQHESGAFFCALDADSEGEEGKYYVWSYEELDQLLGNDWGAFSSVFEVSPSGNFEGKNHLVRRSGAAVDSAALKQWKNLLLKEREKRIRPGLDDKIITSWNALMLTAYTDAWRAFADNHFLQKALRLADFLMNTMQKEDGKLMRNFKNGHTSIEGFLDDYSFFTEAMISVYEMTLDEKYLSVASRTVEYMIQYFFNMQSGLFFYTSINDAPLITRKTETSDEVIPSSNSTMAHALYRLSVLLGRDEWKRLSEKMMQQVKATVEEHPVHYANWARLEELLAVGMAEVVVAGESAHEWNSELQKNFLPDAVLMGGTTSGTLPQLKDKFVDGETNIYICRNRTCSLPLKDTAAALNLLRGKNTPD